MDEKKNIVALATETPEQKKQMSIYDYEEKYVKRQNTKGIKFLLSFGAVALSVIVFTCLFLLGEKVYNINEYAGYVAFGILLIFYIVFFIAPMVKVFQSDYFMTNVNTENAKKAKKHNRETRKAIAEKMIDFTAKVEGAGWYNSEEIGKLAIAVTQNNDKDIKSILDGLYTGSVKKTAKEIIANASLRAGTLSAISQSGTADAAIIAFINIQMMKDLVFLYGFRPSDAKLLKIYVNVLENTLIAYGLNSVSIGKSVAKITKAIPILGEAISVLVDSSVQGLTNGVLTTVMGYQAIRFLINEYHLQNVLDETDLCESTEEMEQSVTDLENELKSANKKKATL